MDTGVVGRYLDLTHRFLECILTDSVYAMQGDKPAGLDPVPCGRHHLPRPQSRVIIMTVTDSVYPFHLSGAVVAVAWSHRTSSTVPLPWETQPHLSLECSAGVTDVRWDVTVTLLLFFIYEIYFLYMKYIFLYEIYFHRLGCLECMPGSHTTCSGSETTWGGKHVHLLSLSYIQCQKHHKHE